MPCPEMLGMKAFFIHKVLFPWAMTLPFEASGWTYEGECSSIHTHFPCTASSHVLVDNEKLAVSLVYYHFCTVLVVWWQHGSMGDLRSSPLSHDVHEVTSGLPPPLSLTCYKGLLRGYTWGKEEVCSLSQPPWDKYRNVEVIHKWTEYFFPTALRRAIAQNPPV